jgi:putative ubiquitin-RnfH superfamily antitoxin RatB of RatAB toxin-antitoxin module
MAPADSRRGEIEVVYALPHLQRVVTLPLPESGLTVAEAVTRSGLLEQFPEIAERELVLAVFGVLREASHQVRAGDRVEVLRPLRHDPRALRRERAAAAPRRKAGRR